MGFLDKQWFASKTWLGAVVAVLGIILSGLGIDVDLTSLEDGMSIMEIIAIFGALLGIYGLRDAIGKLIAFIKELVDTVADLRKKVEGNE